MLSDLISSARGPGVIGIVIALVVLLGFGSLFTVVTDGANEIGGPNVQFQIKAKQRSIRIQERKMKALEQNIVEYDNHSQQLAEFESVQKSLSLKLVELKESELGVETAKTDLVKLAIQFEDYKKQYRSAERGRAVGETLDTFVTKDGKEYQQVSIRRVSALGMEIRHKNGSKRIHYENLPNEMQDRFQFAQKDADKLSALEDSTIKKADIGKANYNRTVRQKRNKTLSRNYRENVARWRTEISQCNSRIQSNETKVMNLRSQRYSNAGIRDSPSTIARKIKRLQESSAKSRDRISELNRKIQKAPVL